MNTVKHTPGLWSVVNSTVYLLNARGTNRLTVAVMPGRTDEDKRVSDEEVLEIAQRIGRFLNSHDDLVEAVTMARTAFASIANGIHAPEKYAHKCALAMDDVLAILSKATHPAPYNTAPESAHVVGSEEQEGVRFTSWCDTHSRATPCDKCAADGVREGGNG